jgi:hypothetical protein
MDSELIGQETTSNGLSFCIMELGRNPDVFQKYEAFKLIFFVVVDKIDIKQ